MGRGRGRGRGVRCTSGVVGGPGWRYFQMSDPFSDKAEAYNAVHVANRHIIEKVPRSKHTQRKKHAQLQSNAWESSSKQHRQIKADKPTKNNTVDNCDGDMT